MSLILPSSHNTILAIDGGVSFQRLQQTVKLCAHGRLGTSLVLLPTESKSDQPTLLWQIERESRARTPRQSLPLHIKLWRSAPSSPTHPLTPMVNLQPLTLMIRRVYGTCLSGRISIRSLASLLVFLTPPSSFALRMIGMRMAFKQANLR